MSTKPLLHCLFVYLASYFKPVKNADKKNDGSASIPHSRPYKPPEGMSQDEYDIYFSDPDIRKAAFEKAWQIRNFEIDLYWKRAAYFWAFIAATFAGYIAVISSDNYPKNSLIELEYYLICLGVIFSFAWSLVNWGSKKWQENWEGHIDRLEESFTGPLYRIISSGASHSVSKVNLSVSIFIGCIWILLGVQYISRHITFCNSTNGLAWYFIISTVASISFIVLVLFWGRTSKKSKRQKYILRDSK